LEHQTSHAVCFNARGLLYGCIFDALLFSSSYPPIGKSNSHHVVTRPTFFSSYFLDHHTSHPARHDARILLMSASSIPSEFFSSSFRSIGSMLPIGRHSTSSFGKTTNRSAAQLIYFSFFFGPMSMLFDLSIALRFRHDLSKVATPTPRSGACETWVPLGPHRPGSRSSPTSGSGLLDDPPTCQWAQPT
jgi:hypothetical protein